MKVTLFVQCLVDTLAPEVAEAVVLVLERLGLTVTCPGGQTCCGQPAWNAGFRHEARKAAERFIALFEDAELIVCPSGSCTHMVRNHYLELFRDDAPWLARAREVSRRVFEFSEFVVDVLGVEDVGARFKARVTYHDSCHLNRYLGIKEQPRRLIRHIRGIDFVEMRDSERCCGFGGQFALKYPEISTAILKDKVANVLASEAQHVVGCDMGCLLNIQGMLRRMGSRVSALHIAQLLAQEEA